MGNLIGSLLLTMPFLFIFLYKILYQRWLDRNVRVYTEHELLEFVIPDVEVICKVCKKHIRTNEEICGNCRDYLNKLP